MQKIKKVLNNNKGMAMVEFVVLLSVILVLATILISFKDFILKPTDSVNEGITHLENEDKILNIDEIIVK